MTDHLATPDLAQAGQTGLTVGWNSDFQGNTRAGTGILTYSVSPDGLTITGIATYPAS